MNLKGRKDRQLPDAKQAEEVVNDLTDKTYGAPVEESKSSSVIRTTISIDEALMLEVQDLAYANKRAKKVPKSVSAVISDALRLYLMTHKEM